MQRPQRRDEGAPLHPEQSQADEDDERVAEISMTSTARFIVAAVAFNSAAAMPTTATATSACSSAEANDSTTPRLQVSSLATR